MPIGCPFNWQELMARCNPKARLRGRTGPKPWQFVLPASWSSFLPFDRCALRPSDLRAWARESDCFLSPWKSEDLGRYVRVLKNRLQSMALKPGASAVSGKDGLFPALLGEDGAWFVLGVRMVG